MTDIESLLAANSPPGQPVLVRQVQQDVDGQRQCEDAGSPPDRLAEMHEPLALLAGVALAPPCGDGASCTCGLEVCSYLEVKRMELSLQSMQLQLQFFMSKVEDLHCSLVNGQGLDEREALAAVVPSFIFTCRPYFDHLESIAQRTVPQHTPLPFDFYTKRVQLLNLSQQLCDSLEQLVLTYASYNLLCLDETDPNNLSHFCIGQRRLGQLKLTVFRYCQPTPYLARVNTGLLKRMRWNVDRLPDERQMDAGQGGEREETEADTAAETEYYFLCCRGDSGRRMWSIGQWVQVYPDPEDIDDWVLCEVPEASYKILLVLGSEEPSSCRATDYLQQLLTS
ncbi:UPF0575 protein C19orf67 homolog [Aulostomus maculatus]